MTRAAGLETLAGPGTDLLGDVPAVEAKAALGSASSLGALAGGSEAVADG